MTLDDGKARGCKNVYGATVGIIMLETSFPRIQGDIANATTFDFPVNYAVVPSVSVHHIVKNLAVGRLNDFLAVAKSLQALGVDGITTNCGFLIVLQEALREQLNISCLTSSLLQIPMVQATLPKGQRVGVITFDKASLQPQLLCAAGAPLDTPVVGIDGTELNRVILADENILDVEQVRKDMLDATKRLLLQAPDVGAIVLECTNMPPYSYAIQREFGLPVYDVVTMVNWFHSGLAARRYAHH